MNLLLYIAFAWLAASAVSGLLISRYISRVKRMERRWRDHDRNKRP